MSERKAKQQRREHAAARKKLERQLVEYWFENQPAMSEEQAAQIRIAMFLRISALSDMELEQLRQASVRDVTRRVAALPGGQ